MTLINDIIKEKSSLLKKIKLVTQYLDAAPNGILVCRKKNDSYRYARKIKTKGKATQVTARSEIYLRKDDPLLLNLAQRDYYKQYLKDLQQELAGVEEYLKQHEKAVNVQTYLEKHHGIRKILQPALIDRTNKYAKWAAAPYQKNPFHPEGLIYITKGGFYVRSKAEQMIANMYIDEGIPFRYEDPVIMPDGNVIYPDFHLFSLRDYSEWYHEHNGMMLNEDYFLRYEKKVRSFRSAKIIPGVNLLQTFEAEGHPLNPACVQHLIDTYLH